MGLIFTLFWLISLMGGVDIYLVLAHQFNDGLIFTLFWLISLMGVFTLFWLISLMGGLIFTLF